MKRGFLGERMWDFYIGRRYCVRVWERPKNASWRPYFSTRYCIAMFGVWRVGVQIMRVMTHAEIATFNPPLDQPAYIANEFRAAPRVSPDRSPSDG